MQHFFYLAADVFGFFRADEFIFYGYSYGKGKVVGLGFGRELRVFLFLPVEVEQPVSERTQQVELFVFDGSEQGGIGTQFAEYVVQGILAGFSVEPEM